LSPLSGAPTIGRRSAHAPPVPWVRRAAIPITVSMPPTAPAPAPFPFDNSFARELEGCFRPARPAPVRDPRLVQLNRELADELGLDADRLDSAEGARWFTGAELPPGAEPIAQAYAGHQFGHFVPQLGDGRALLLGEVVDRVGRRRDVQLKGSGPTHFSRGGDGLSALGPVLREYVVSEGMHALGVPTTRALAAATTDQPVFRERELPGAVLTRVASSHLRVGSFQFFAARGEGERVQRHADHAIARHDADLVDAPDRYLRFFERVRDRQADLVARWMAVGFVHGVMNTDNTTVSGETIDYGPCAFMERYDEATVFSSIDRHGRYAYGRQPRLMLWNLVRFAETLVPLFDQGEERALELGQQALEAFQETYEARWLARFRAKLGLSTESAGDADLVESFLAALHAGEVDFTNAFRALSAAADGEEGPLRALFGDPAPLEAWLERLARESTPPAERAAALRAVNPAFVPRNLKVEEAIEAAVERDDFGPFRELLAVVTRPFDDQPGREAYAEPAPPDAEPYVTFCGT